MELKIEAINRNQCRESVSPTCVHQLVLTVYPN